MPYGFYMLVRFLSVVGFAYLAFEASKEKNETLMFIFIALAVLFQPFFKVPLGRYIWSIVDVIIAISLLISIFKTKTNILK